MDGPEPLPDNPFIKTVLHLLAIVRYGWRREDVLNFRKSSYTAADRLDADLLRRRAHAAGVRSGREGWLRLIAHDPSASGLVGEMLRGMAEAEVTLTAVDALPIERADALRAAIAAFGLEQRIDKGEATRSACDRTAWEAALSALNALTEMTGFADRPMLTFAEFHDRLLSVWHGTNSTARPEGDIVRVMEPYDTRERPLRFAAVMGMTERVFPRRVTEDPFLRDDERLLLRERAGLELEAQKNRTDDERFFFYLAVTAPRSGCFSLFRARRMRRTHCPRSYLDEVRDALPDVEMVPARWRMSRRTRRRPFPKTIVLLAACADLFDPGATRSADLRRKRERAAADTLGRLAADGREGGDMRAVVSSRTLPGLPRLNDAPLRADFAGKKTIFSVSELEILSQRCPFQYLLRHVLRLRPEEDDATPRAQGTLLHAILRRYFSALTAQQAALPDVKTLRAELRDLLTETLETANLDASPHRLRMTQRMLTDALDGFAERETRFSPQFNMTPAHFEVAFGLRIAGRAALEDDERAATLLHDGGPES